MRIGQKLWIFYKWPIFECVWFFLLRLYITLWNFCQRYKSVLHNLAVSRNLFTLKAVTQRFASKLCVTAFKQHHELSFGREFIMEKFFLTWTFLNHQRCKKMPSFFKKLTISLKLSVKIFFKDWNLLAKIKLVGYIQKNQG